VESAAVQVQNSAPTANNVSASGSLVVGEILIGDYTYDDVDGDPEGNTTYRWLRADNASGTNESAIAGATQWFYELSPADEGKYISFEVTPVAASGTTTGLAVGSARYGPVLNAAPEAYSVTISGIQRVGAVLTGSYVYSDAEGDPEGASQYRWLRADDASGTNETAINGATSITYTPTTSDQGKYISFEVTPAAASGTSPGPPTASQPVGGIANITVSAISGNTTEAGGTATFTVVLDSEPTADVSITVSSSDASEGSVSPANLTFGAGNWNTPQTVTAAGVNDDVDDDDQAYTAILSAATSTDPKYNGLDPGDVSVTNTDDDTAGTTVSAISGNTTEAGGTATSTVVLDSEPTADVSITVSSSDAGEGSVSTANLTFGAGNWNTPQTVTVTGVNDDVDDDDQAYTAILSAATSTDPKYNGLDPGDVAVTNTDDDTAGITVSAISGNTTEAGGTATFTVVLNSEPTADVNIAVTSSEPGEGTVSPAALIFDASNWKTTRTVTVTGVDDGINDSNKRYQVILTAAVSSDILYNGMNADDLELLNISKGNDNRPVANSSSLTVTEDISASGILSADDVDDDPLTYMVVSQGTKGLVTITDSDKGNFTYTPNANTDGSDSFTFKVSDGEFESNVATISVSIQAVNDGPSISSISATQIVENTSSGQIQFTVDDIDTALDSLTLQGTSSNSNVVLNSNITFGGTGKDRYAIIAPVTDTYGTSEITISVGDGSETAQTQFTLTVNPAAPAAAMSAKPETGRSPLTVNFIDKSTGHINSWNWNFGDSGTSTKQSPEHTYQTPGTYTVTLTVQGPGGQNIKIAQNLINVEYEPIGVTFQATGDREGMKPFSVTFTRETQGQVTSYLWEFGDGQTSNDASPTHNFQTAGTFTVKLTATGPAGTAAAEKENYIHVIESRTIAGNVKAADTGQGLSGYKVRAWAEDEILGTASTDGSGNYTLGGVTPESGIVLEVFLDGGTTYHPQFYNNKDKRQSADRLSLVSGDLSNIDFELQPIPQAGIKGRIHDGNNQAVPGIAAVNLFSESGSFVKTASANASGEYSFTQLKADALFTVRVWSDQFNSDFYYAIPEGETVGVYIPTRSAFLKDNATLVTAKEPAVENIDIIVNQGGTIAGHVYEPDGTTSIEGIWVNAQSPDLNIGNGAATDAGGAYLITGLAHVDTAEASEKGYLVTVSTSDYLYQVYNGVTSSANATKVATGQTGVDFVLKKEADLSGSITDDAGAALPSVEVTAWSSTTGISKSATSEATGGYSIENLKPANDYVVTAFLSGYPIQYYQNKSTQSDANSIDLSKGDLSGINFELSKGPAVSGKVYIESPSTPAPRGIIVSIWSNSTSTGGNVQTDSQGMFEISGLDADAGDYIISIHHSDYQPAFYADNQDSDPDNDTVYTLSVAKGVPASQTNRNLILKTGFFMKGAVTYNGEMIEKAQIEVSASEIDAWARAISDDPGTGGTNYTIKGLAAAVYQVKVRMDGFLDTTSQVDINEDKTVNFILEKEPRYTLSGTVTGLTAGTSVKIDVWSLSKDYGKVVEVLGTADDTVSYEVSGLRPASDYIVEMISSDYPYQVYDGHNTWDDADVINLSEDTSGIDFVVESITARVSGTVTFPEGAGAGDSAVVELFSKTTGVGRGTAVTLSQESVVPYTISLLVKEKDYYALVRSDRYIGQFYQQADDLSDATLINLTDGIADSNINFVLGKGAIISGKISGEQIEGIRVMAWSDALQSGDEVISSADGSYLVKGLRPADDYIVDARKPGEPPFYYHKDDTLVIREKASASLISTKQGDVENINIAISAGESIKGIVRDKKGQGLSDIWIEAWSSTRQAGNGLFTGSDGAYEIKGLPPGKDYKVTAKPGVALPYLSQTLPQVATDSEDVNFSLNDRAGYTVKGKVLYNNDPVANVKIEIRSDSDPDLYGLSISDQSGNYQITNLPAADDYVIEASPPDFSAFAFTSEAGVAVNQDITKNIELTAAHRVAGTVYRKEDKTPLKGIKVTAFSANTGFWGEALTNSNGIYEIPNTPFASDYAVVASGEGFTDLKKVEQYPEINIDFYLDESGSISGEVRDKNTGVPLANVLVETYSNYMEGVSGYEGIAATDTKGKYLIKGLKAKDPAGNLLTDYIVNVAADGYPPHLAGAKKVGDIVNFFLATGAANEISGTVENADGAEVVVEIFVKDGDFVNSVGANSDGTFKVSGLQSNLEYELNFIAYEGDKEAFSQWASQGATGDYDIGVTDPGLAKAYKTNSSVTFRFDKSLSGAQQDRRPLGAVRELLSSSHFTVTLKPEASTGVKNLYSPVSKIVSNNPKVTVAWEPSSEGAVEKYYHLFNQTKNYTITKRNAPKTRPIKARRATSIALNGDDEAFYFHVCVVDNRGRLSSTSTIGFRIDTQAPTNINVSAPSVSASASINLKLGASGASEMYLSNIAYGQGGSWENYARAKRWRLTQGEGEKQIYIQFRDRAGNTANALVYTKKTEPQPEQFSIKATAGDNGSISPSGDISINDGDDKPFVITPATGYEIDTLTIDGKSESPSNNTYTFVKVTDDHTIHVTFKTMKLQITGWAGANGTITPSGAVSADYGDDLSFTVSPQSGFTVDAVTVDDTPVDLTNNTYTFTRITTNHSINATFKSVQYVITAGTDSNGSIVPGGQVSVNKGDAKSFTITPNEGYQVDKILLDGSIVLLSEGNRFNFINVDKAHTLSVTFKPLASKQYTITATSGTYGSITPAGPVRVDAGQSKTFTIAPATGTDPTGYEIDAVLVDGKAVALENGKSYTFVNVGSDHRIEVRFKRVQHTITASAGKNGRIFAAGDVRVNQGADQTFVIIPNPQYIIDSVQVDGKQAELLGNTFTFRDVRGNHRILANFTSMPDLGKVIQVLQILVGMSPPQSVPIEDVNGDNRIGIEEAIHLMGELAELR